MRTTSNGSKVAQFSLATGRQWTTPSGEKQEKTEWHKCVAWNGKGSGLADVIERYVKKGDKISAVYSEAVAISVKSPAKKK